MFNKLRKKSSSHKSLAAVFAQEVPTAPVPRLEPLEGGEDFRSSVILPDLGRRFSLLINTFNPSPSNLRDLLHSSSSPTHTGNDSIQLTQEEEEIMLEEIRQLREEKEGQFRQGTFGRMGPSGWGGLSSPTSPDGGEEDDDASGTVSPGGSSAAKKSPLSSRTRWGGSERDHNYIQSVKKSSSRNIASMASSSDAYSVVGREGKEPPAGGERNGHGRQMSDILAMEEDPFASLSPLSASFPSVDPPQPFFFTSSSPLNDLPIPSPSLHLSGTPTSESPASFYPLPLPSAASPSSSLLPPQPTSLKGAKRKSLLDSLSPIQIERISHGLAQIEESLARSASPSVNAAFSNVSSPSDPSHHHHQTSDASHYSEGDSLTRSTGLAVAANFPHPPSTPSQSLAPATSRIEPSSSSDNIARRPSNPSTEPLRVDVSSESTGRDRSKRLKGSISSILEMEGLRAGGMAVSPVGDDEYGREGPQTPVLGGRARSGSVSAKEGRVEGYVPGMPRPITPRSRSNSSTHPTPSSSPVFAMNPLRSPLSPASIRQPSYASFNSSTQPFSPELDASQNSYPYSSSPKQSNTQELPSRAQDRFSSTSSSSPSFIVQAQSFTSPSSQPESRPPPLSRSGSGGMPGSQRSLHSYLSASIVEEEEDDRHLHPRPPSSSNTSSSSARQYSSPNDDYGHTERQPVYDSNGERSAQSSGGAFGMDSSELSQVESNVSSWAEYGTPIEGSRWPVDEGGRYDVSRKEVGEEMLDEGTGGEGSIEGGGEWLARNTRPLTESFSSMAINGHDRWSQQLSDSQSSHHHHHQPQQQQLQHQAPSVRRLGSHSHQPSHSSSLRHHTTVPSSPSTASLDSLESSASGSSYHSTIFSLSNHSPVSATFASSSSSPSNPALIHHGPAHSRGLSLLLDTHKKGWDLRDSYGVMRPATPSGLAAAVAASDGGGEENQKEELLDPTDGEEERREEWMDLRVREVLGLEGGMESVRAVQEWLLELGRARLKEVGDEAFGLGMVGGERGELEVSAGIRRSLELEDLMGTGEAQSTSRHTPPFSSPNPDFTPPPKFTLETPPLPSSPFQANPLINERRPSNAPSLGSRQNGSSPHHHLHPSISTSPRAAPTPLSPSGQTVMSHREIEEKKAQMMEATKSLKKAPSMPKLKGLKKKGKDLPKPRISSPQFISTTATFNASNTTAIAPSPSLTQMHPVTLSPQTSPAPSAPSTYSPGSRPSPQPSVPNTNAATTTSMSERLRRFTSRKTSSSKEKRDKDIKDEEFVSDHRVYSPPSSPPSSKPTGRSRGFSRPSLDAAFPVASPESPRSPSSPPKQSRQPFRFPNNDTPVSPAATPEVGPAVDLAKQPEKKPTLKPKKSFLGRLRSRKSDQGTSGDASKNATPLSAGIPAMPLPGMGARSASGPPSSTAMPRSPPTAPPLPLSPPTYAPPSSSSPITSTKSSRRDSLPPSSFSPPSTSNFEPSAGRQSGHAPRPSQSESLSRFLSSAKELGLDPAEVSGLLSRSNSISRSHVGTGGDVSKGSISSARGEFGSNGNLSAAANGSGGVLAGSSSSRSLAQAVEEDQLEIEHLTNPVEPQQQIDSPPPHPSQDRLPIPSTHSNYSLTTSDALRKSTASSRNDPSPDPNRPSKRSSVVRRTLILPKEASRHSLRHSLRSSLRHPLNVDDYAPDGHPPGVPAIPTSISNAFSLSTSQNSHDHQRTLLSSSQGHSNQHLERLLSKRSSKQAQSVRAEGRGAGGHERNDSNVSYTSRYTSDTRSFVAPREADEDRGEEEEVLEGELEKDGSASGSLYDLYSTYGDDDDPESTQIPDQRISAAYEDATEDQPAIEILEMSNGDVVYSVLAGLRNDSSSLSDKDIESSFPSYSDDEFDIGDYDDDDRSSLSRASRAESLADEPMQLTFKGASSPGGKQKEKAERGGLMGLTLGTHGGAGRKSVFRRRGEDGKMRPETKIFYSSSRQVAELIAEISRGHDAGNFNFSASPTQTSFPPIPLPQQITTSPMNTSFSSSQQPYLEPPLNIPSRGSTSTTNKSHLRRSISVRRSNSLARRSAEERDGGPSSLPLLNLKGSAAPSVASGVSIGTKLDGLLDSLEAAEREVEAEEERRNGRSDSYASRGDWKA